MRELVVFNTVGFMRVQKTLARHMISFFPFEDVAYVPLDIVNGRVLGRGSVLVCGSRIQYSFRAGG
jgi:flagellar motor switch/type III secretory pathway protein FliN